MYKIIIILIITLLSACQNLNSDVKKHPSDSVDENSTEQYQKKALSAVILCHSYKSPPVKDKARIEELLMKKGIVTGDMSSEKINKTVNEYIREKQNTYKECNK